MSGFQISNDLVNQHAYNPTGSIFAEQSYLLFQLQSENDKAINILRQISALETKLPDHRPAKLHKRTRQQIVWLNNRLDQIMKQEKSILNRLSCVTSGIQSQSGWIPLAPDRPAYVQCQNYEPRDSRGQGAFHLIPEPPKKLPLTYIKREYHQDIFAAGLPLLPTDLNH